MFNILAASDQIKTITLNASNLGWVIVSLVVLLLLSYIIVSFLFSYLFQKAGVPKWVAWVPFYSLWTLLRLGDQSGYWVILMVIPYANWVATVFIYMAAFRISKKLGKGDWFVLLAIFLPIIWLIWLGFDDSVWPKAKTPRKKPAVNIKPSTHKKSIKK